MQNYVSVLSPHAVASCRNSLASAHTQFTCISLPLDSHLRQLQGLLTWLLHSGAARAAKKSNTPQPSPRQPEPPKESLHVLDPAPEAAPDPAPVAQEAAPDPAPVAQEAAPVAQERAAGLNASTPKKGTREPSPRAEKPKEVLTSCLPSCLSTHMQLSFSCLTFSVYLLCEASLCSDCTGA